MTGLPFWIVACTTVVLNVNWVSGQILTASSTRTGPQPTVADYLTIGVAQVSCHGMKSTSLT